MRISDWSSDVCSSDLHRRREARVEVAGADEIRKACHVRVEVVPVGDVEVEAGERRGRELFLDLGAEVVDRRFGDEHLDQDFEAGVMARNQEMAGVVAGIAETVEQRRGGGENAARGHNRVSSGEARGREAGGGGYGTRT